MLLTVSAGQVCFNKFNPGTNIQSTLVSLSTCFQELLMICIGILINPLLLNNQCFYTSFYKKMLYYERVLQQNILEQDNCKRFQGRMCNSVLHTQSKTVLLCG